MQYFEQTMDKDKIYTKIQEIVNACSPPVIVLGSGVSIPYGIASMGDLAAELCSFFKSQKYESDDSNRAVNEFLQNLESGKSLEDALLDVRVPDEVEMDIINIVWEIISTQNYEAYMKLLQGEKITLKTLFEHIIYNRCDITLNVVSTNYDNLAEYAASQTDAYINNGFSPTYCGRRKEQLDACQINAKEAYVGKINIWKPHGSVDWFSKGEETFYLPNLRQIPQGYRPCIVTPGVNKFARTQHSPHRELMTEIDKCFNQASGFLCFGYGFNDEHIHPKLLDKARKRNLPIVIIVKEITQSIQDNVINQGYNYIILSHNGKDGTTITAKDQSPLEIEHKKLWTVDGFCEILK